MTQSMVEFGPLTPQLPDGQQWMHLEQPEQPHQGMMQEQPMQIQPGRQQHQQTQEEVKTLWVGELQYWMDEAYLDRCFVHTGDVRSVKIIRNKQTCYSEGYGFVEFTSHAAAERSLQGYTGSLMPQTEQPFRLNWASFGIGERSPEHSIFVGDLAPDVTDYMLQETFRTRYPSTKGAKVVTDANTGRSQGYGFVRFGDEMERNLAMTEMNSVYCSSRPMRISAATPKKSARPAQQMSTKVSPAATPYQQLQAYGVPPAAPAFALATDNDPNNTTIFVGGLDPSVTDDDVKQVFSVFSNLVYVKILLGKGCGFVQFTHRACAEEALQRLHGTVIGQQAIRLSWGHSPGKKQVSQDGQCSPLWGHQLQQDPNQWNGGYNGYQQGYDCYGYSQLPQDPGAYAYGNYAGYGNYQQQSESQAGIAPASITNFPVKQEEEEVFDPLALSDIDQSNAAYIAVHEVQLLGRHLWLKQAQPA